MSGRTRRTSVRNFISNPGRWVLYHSVASASSSTASGERRRALNGGKGDSGRWVTLAPSGTARPPRDLRPPDIIAHTQTPAVPGTDATAPARSLNESASAKSWRPRAKRSSPSPVKMRRRPRRSNDDTPRLDASIPDEVVTVDYLMNNVWFVGDPSECADKIQHLHEESGGFGTLLSIATDADDADWDHDSLRLLMEDVAPPIARLT